jgi:hypothetical protein
MAGHDTDEHSGEHATEQQREHRADQSGEGQPTHAGQGQSRGQKASDTARDVKAAGAQPRRGSTVRFGDLLHRTDTTTEIKVGVGLFAAVGLGFGIVVLFAQGLATGVAFTGTGFAATVAPVLAVLTARRQATRLSSIRGDLIYGTTTLTSAGGAVAMLVFVWVFEVLAASPAGPVDLLLVAVGVAAASGAVGFLSLVAVRET